MAEAPNASFDVLELSNLHPSCVFQPGTPEYTAVTTTYFATFENEVRPACVVEPNNAQELGKIVKDLASVIGNANVAIKGGGYTP